MRVYARAAEAAHHRAVSMELLERLLDRLHARRQQRADDARASSVDAVDAVIANIVLYCVCKSVF
jgi:hypothetical protein